MATRSSSFLVRTIVLVLILGGGAYAAIRFDLFGQWLKRNEGVALEGVPVRRGDLLISELVRGNLESSESTELKAQIDGEAKLTFLAEEGSLLKKGDTVAIFDVSQFEEKKNRQEIEVKNAEAAVTKAEENIDIQTIQNQSDLAAAELELQLAQMDLEKYSIEGGEWTNELAAAQESILLKEENLAKAQKDLEWTQKLFDEGFVQRQQLEGDQLAVQSAEIGLTQARRDLELKQLYGHKRKKAELEANVGTRERNVEKVRKQARSRMADLTASLESARYRLERERKELTRYTDQLSKGTLVSPEDGYFVMERTWRGRSFKEGDDVWGGTRLGTIPKSDTMVMQAAIHETKLKKIREGMTCKVTTDAFPGMTVNGKVVFVAIMASEQDWRRGGNEKMYKATIELENTPAGFRPGMSCNAEILIENLQDALYVPRQCVLFDAGETIVFVPGPSEAQRKVVEVGLDNNNYVQITSGLSEGDLVLLAPPPSFRPTDAPPAEQPADAVPGAPEGEAPSVPANLPGRGGAQMGGPGGGGPGAGGPGAGGRGPGKGRRGPGGVAPGGAPGGGAAAPAKSEAKASE
ncbi:MAG TPA: efflux RND transporter periplasmic adaptor subunit [Planctomycetota bacterium]|nr:efflux RND transporter periplasmic adaptor subunit [Planctomycetota bacterium]HRV81212.1 efflux RND transporter periplasmic adaptor subunit [Planctomycetota bacterium]